MDATYKSYERTRNQKSPMKTMEINKNDKFMNMRLRTSS